MRTEVYVNDQLIDIDTDATVAATYGNITFGELNKRKGVKSNTWSSPFSQRNKLVMESCEIASSYSAIPYRKNTIRVDISGITVFEGFCIIDEAEDGYKIQSYAGASDFYSLISTRKLKELNLSAYSHIWGEASIRNSWTRVDGYIYAYVNYGKEPFYDTQGWPQNHSVQPDYMLPQIFFSTVVKAIATDAGYNLTGAVLTDDRFLKHVIIANKFPITINYGGVFDLSTLLPDLTQSKVWLDFANIYGLQFDIDDGKKEIRCTYIDDLLFNETEEWTDKVDKSEKRKTNYAMSGYGQSNYLRFKSDPDTDQNGCPQDYSYNAEIDNETLDAEADIYKSDFYLIQNPDYPSSVRLPFTRTFNIKNGSYLGIWDPAYNYFKEGLYVWRSGTYYVSLQAGTNKMPGVETSYWEPKPEKDIWEIKSRAMYGMLTVDIESPLMVAFGTPVNVNRVVKADGLDWTTSYEKHYKVFNRIIDHTKIADILIKLNYADVNQISFDRLKTIDGELYVLEEVTQFKLNKPDSTICKFIRL